MSNLAIARAEKDDLFAYHPQSPLDHAQRENFEGLSYFPEDETLRLALEIDEFEQKEEIEIQTSTGDVQPYIRYGKIHFDVEGKPASLTVYQSNHGFFIPFVDSQAGRETYGAGRYLDPDVLPDGKLLVDFNLAYNPYCAYNDRWSCPLTPWENRLKVPIKAGEKNYNTES